MMTQRRLSIALIACACALLLSSCGVDASRSSASNCEKYVFAAASELVSGLRARGYDGAVVDEGVEGTWYQNEVAQLTQQLELKYHLGSRVSNAWSGVLHDYLSGSTLRKLATRKMVKPSDRAMRSSVERECVEN